MCSAEDQWHENGSKKSYLREFAVLTVKATFMHTGFCTCFAQSAVLRSAKKQAPTETDPDWLDQIAADPVLLSAILSPFNPESTPISAETRQMLLNIEWKLARLLEAQPHHADRQLLLARLQAKLDSIPAAMLSLQRAMRANPNLVDAHRLKSQLHARIGEPDQALTILRDLLARGFSWPDLHYEIAALEQQQGHASEARAHL